MRRFLSVLGLLLALAGAGFRPAEAYPAGFTATLGGSPCVNRIASLDFAGNSGNGVYCLNGTRYASPSAIPGWSFSRASTGTALTSSGTIVSFGSGVPRITDLGLLIEQSATNLALQSQTFSSASWVKTSLTAGAPSALAPDGTSTASQISGTNAAFAVASQAVAATASQAYTLSAFIKAGTASQVALRLDTTFDSAFAGVIFDASTGAFVAYTDSATTFTTQTLAGGWYRVSVTATVASGTQNNARIYLVKGGSLSNSVATTDNAFIWGAQLEQSSAASSYIPTTSAAVTRAADALTLTYAPAGSAATVTYGTNSTASVSPTSPINLGSASGGAWVGNYIRKLVVTP